MKIICSVEVINRNLPTLNLKSGKALKSSLALVKTSEKEVFLFHQSNQNTSGRKYKIRDNITNVFVKFANEGKATIRFKEPEHDLAIKCDPVQLKGFLRTLKLSIDGIPSQQLSSLQSGNLQTKTVKAVKTKLKITSKEEYPTLEGFPRTLETLLINNANQKTLDSRILRLRNLRILNIESNNLSTLPEPLGASLPNLVELHLANNSLGLSGDWRWIVNSRLQKQLRLLDLRSNGILQLPDKMVKLVNLVTLKLDNNSLERLPNGIGCMKNLRYFSASNNRITYLPGSILVLKLESIDLSRNTFSDNVHKVCINLMTKKLSYADFQGLPSLVDIAATTVIMKRIAYSEETLPQTLIEHLETASFCVCGKPCFSKHPESYIRYQDCHRCASIIVSSYDCAYTVAVRYCSLRCYMKGPSL